MDIVMALIHEGIPKPIIADLNTMIRAWIYNLISSNKKNTFSDENWTLCNEYSPLPAQKK